MEEPKIPPELEARVVEASRNDDRGSGYGDVFYHALTVHLSKREPSVTRLFEVLASEDTIKVAGPDSLGAAAARR